MTTKKQEKVKWIVVRRVVEYRRRLDELFEEHPEFFEDFIHYSDPDTEDTETFIEEV